VDTTHRDIRPGNVGGSEGQEKDWVVGSTHAMGDSTAGSAAAYKKKVRTRDIAELTEENGAPAEACEREVGGEEDRAA